MDAGHARGMSVHLIGVLPGPSSDGRYDHQGGVDIPQPIRLWIDLEGEFLEGHRTEDRGVVRFTKENPCGSFVRFVANVREAKAPVHGPPVSEPNRLRSGR